MPPLPANPAPKTFRRRAKQLYLRTRSWLRREKLLIPELTGQPASDLIGSTLLAGQPCLVCRFGRVELDAVLRWVDSQAPGSTWQKWLRYLTARSGPFRWDDAFRRMMHNNAGFFPVDDANLARFAGRMWDDMPAIDILGCWLPGETRLQPHFRQARLVGLADLEPYYHANPWSSALQGKRVLVVHPYADTICSQYARREQLFSDPRVLPEFELLTLPAVQSIAGNTGGFASWFDALAWMEAQVQALDFDIAIVGAGAYGLPLAASIKRMGKQAVHLGGAVQILFGIRGRRWDQMPAVNRFYNPAWVRPSASEIPANHQAVERGCYW